MKGRRRKNNDENDRDGITEEKRIKKYGKKENYKKGGIRKEKRRKTEAKLPKKAKITPPPKKK